MIYKSDIMSLRKEIKKKIGQKIKHKTSIMEKEKRHMKRNRNARTVDTVRERERERERESII